MLNGNCICATWFLTLFCNYQEIMYIFNVLILLNCSKFFVYNVHYYILEYLFTDFFFQNYGILPYFANFRLMAELSTPFVNQRSVIMSPFLLIEMGDGRKVYINHMRLDCDFMLLKFL